MIPNTYPIETKAPDITPYRKGNTGVDYVTTLDSGRDGPHVLVVAVTHGNEICGAPVARLYNSKSESAFNPIVNLFDPPCRK